MTYLPNTSQHIPTLPNTGSSRYTGCHLRSGQFPAVNCGIAQFVLLLALSPWFLFQSVPLLLLSAPKGAQHAQNDATCMCQRLTSPFCHPVEDCCAASRRAIRCPLHTAVYIGHVESPCPTLLGRSSTLDIFSPKTMMACHGWGEFKHFKLAPAPLNFSEPQMGRRNSIIQSFEGQFNPGVIQNTLHSWL